MPDDSGVRRLDPGIRTSGRQCGTPAVRTGTLDDFGVDSSGGGITGIGTLIPGGLLVALAVVFAPGFGVFALALPRASA